MQNEGLLVFALFCWAAAFIFFIYTIRDSFQHGLPFFLIGLMSLGMASFIVYVIPKKEETVKITLDDHPNQWYKAPDSELYFFYCPEFGKPMGPYKKPEVYQIISWNYFDEKRVRYEVKDEK